MNPFQQAFDEAVWDEAKELYAKDGLGSLDPQPKEVQDAYRERARKELRDYLATCGIV
jgi:hypothetical protein